MIPLFREPADEQLGPEKGWIGSGPAGDISRGSPPAARELDQWSQGGVFRSLCTV